MAFLIEVVADILLSNRYGRLKNLQGFSVMNVSMIVGTSH
jgi:hypothetical protein